MANAQEIIEQALAREVERAEGELRGAILRASNQLHVKVREKSIKRLQTTREAAVAAITIIQMALNALEATEKVLRAHRHHRLFEDNVFLSPGVAIDQADGAS